MQYNSTKNKLHKLWEQYQNQQIQLTLKSAIQKVRKQHPNSFKRISVLQDSDENTINFTNTVLGRFLTVWSG